MNNIFAEFDPRRKEEARTLYKVIKEKLNLMGRAFTEKIEFKEFLQSLECTLLEYIDAVRSSISRPTVFLRRDTNAIFVNGYNRDLLLCWGANIDFQFVLDTYACAKYCVGYILKSQGGVSKLFRMAIADAKAGNLSIKKKFNKYANTLINGSEICAQEASAFVLGIPNTLCSRVDIYVNTSPAEERTKMLKPLKDLKELNDESEDIYSRGIIDHYINRPDELEGVCLGEFATTYEFTRFRPSREESNGMWSHAAYFIKCLMPVKLNSYFFQK